MTIRKRATGIIKILFWLVLLSSAVSFAALNYKDIIKNTAPDKALPQGFEEVSSVGNTHFLHVTEDYWGDKMRQREIGDKLCDKSINKENYCEVYFFANKADIPTTFPILNRVYPLGIFEMKYGRRSLHTLTGNNPEDRGTTTFVKNRARFSKAYQGQKKTKTDGRAD